VYDVPVETHSILGHGPAAHSQAIARHKYGRARAFFDKGLKMRVLSEVV
jgi:hypothetical protein